MYVYIESYNLFLYCGLDCQFLIMYQNHSIYKTYISFSLLKILSYVHNKEAVLLINCEKARN